MVSYLSRVLRATLNSFSSPPGSQDKVPAFGQTRLISFGVDVFSARNILFDLKKVLFHLLALRAPKLTEL